MGQPSTLTEGNLRWQGEDDTRPARTLGEKRRRESKQREKRARKEKRRE